MADFTRDSFFNPLNNYIKVRFGADASLTETELNELQDILNYKFNRLVNNLIPEGIMGLGEANYDAVSKTFTLTNEVAVAFGEFIDIDNVSIQANLGQTIYLKVFKKLVSHTDTIKKYGNAQGTEEVENKILDDRVGKETSRREQLMYELTTVDDNESKCLPLYEIIQAPSGNLELKAVKTESQTSLQRTLDNAINIVFNTLNDMRNEFSSDMADIKQDVIDEMTSIKDKVQEYNIFRLQKEGKIFKLIELRRIEDNTLYLRSEYSNKDMAGNYLTETVSYFNNQEELVNTEEFILTYNSSNELVSRVGVKNV